MASHLGLQLEQILGGAGYWQDLTRPSCNKNQGNLQKARCHLRQDMAKL